MVVLTLTFEARVLSKVRYHMYQFACKGTERQVEGECLKCLQKEVLWTQVLRYTPTSISVLCRYLVSQYSVQYQSRQLFCTIRLMHRNGNNL